ncbi:MAG: DUF86 domain-containing protein [Treponema sp.]|jgi:uncharacterized protein with HEPN domain|nr:DUF86 domain-containing protein [Treponema sp.]
MPLNENDLSYLIDIADCIIDINEFTDTIQYYQFEKDKMRKLAVERQLEVIGQAANKISIETQNNLGNIPWKNIIGLRNKGYYTAGQSPAPAAYGGFRGKPRGIKPFGSSLARSCPCKHGRDLASFVNKLLEVFTRISR